MSARATQYNKKQIFNLENLILNFIFNKNAFSHYNKSKIKSLNF